MKIAFLDFEYRRPNEVHPQLVAGSLLVNKKERTYWLDSENPIRFPANVAIQHDIQKLLDGDYLFAAYNVVAEARCLLALGFDVTKIKWIDLYLEYRCLSNHNDNYAYGKQLIKGRKKFTKRPVPKWERKDEKDEKVADSMKQEYGLGAAIYKVIGKQIDSEFKTETRDLIVFPPEDRMYTEEEYNEIMTYCSSDTIYLPQLLKGYINEYKRLLGKRYNASELIKEMLFRGEYSARTAVMESLGYSIDYDRTRNFSSQVPNILWSCQHDINRQFEPILGEKIFRPKSKNKPFDLSWNQKLTRDCIKKWCSENNYKNWILTDGGKSGNKDLSLSLKAFQKPISYRHDYPDGNLIAQMQRYLKLKQSLNGFKASGETSAKTTRAKKGFWDYVGSDGRVRPYMGIYGAQSGRSQPAATGFIPLKAAWMRSLIMPNRGRAMASIDFASQEFLLAALLSGDTEMLKAYESGDVYLAFGKAIGYIPQKGTKKSHKKERDECKAVVLGLSYDMSEYGLSTDLSEKFKRKVTPEEALTWINKHKKAYKTFWKWKAKLQRDYKIKKHIKLPDGWYMWGDNDNFRSVGNVPVQGLGSCIMRKAVQLAQEAGLDVTYTLHDALYIEDDVKKIKESVRKLAEAMDASFRFYFTGEVYNQASVRLDADIWSESFSPEVSKFNLDYSGADGKTYEIPVKQQQIYVDERAENDYEKFKPYMEIDNEDFYRNLRF